MSITVIMPILGRPLFTLRSLWYLNSIGFPWRIIVADGGNDPTIRRLLGGRSYFPRLDLVYYRRRDVDVRAFYQKCLNAIRMVETPYVLILDNDDFVTVDAMTRLAAFLDEHPEHSAVSGIVATFDFAPTSATSALPFVQGDVDRWVIRYQPKFLDQATPAERIKQHLSRYFPTYYSLHRTAALERAYDFLVRSGISDLPLHEIFLSLHTLLSGKIITLGSTIGYLRQGNISEAHATVRPWPHRVLQEPWQADFHLAIRQFSELMHVAEPVLSVSAARELLQQGIGGFLRTVSDGSVNHASVPGTLDVMLAEISSYGATPQDCRQLTEDMSRIQHCLRDTAFRRFVLTEASGLLVKWKLRRLPSHAWALWQGSARH